MYSFQRVICCIDNDNKISAFALQRTGKGRPVEKLCNITANFTSSTVNKVERQ